jgi:fructan beta-fructosidase
MNDPNGLVWHNGRWHLCYQHAPEHVCWDWGMHWGHAISHDLTHWEHWPIALSPDNLGAIFSGSAAVIDKGTNKELVACFTHAGDKRQAQSLAFSRDEGKTWTKYEGNPVLTIDRTDFRDPKIFRYGSGWRMILAAGFEAQIYSSPDLIEWTFQSAFQAPVPNCTWECPDLIEIDGRWILIASLIIPNSLPREGNNSRYWMGVFDGVKFTAESGPHNLSLGPDDYAAVSWNDVPDQRRIIVGWMSHWTYANQTPTKDEGWRGVMTLPRVLSIEDGVLIQRPPNELMLRRTSAQLLTEAGLEIDALAFEIDMELDLTQHRAVAACVELSNNSNELLRIVYNKENNDLCIDREKSGNVDFHPEFAGAFRQPLHVRDELLRLTIFVDRCSVEIFAQGGRLYGASLIFPTSNRNRVNILGQGVRIKKGTLHAFQ